MHLLESIFKKTEEQNNLSPSESQGKKVWEWLIIIIWSYNTLFLTWQRRLNNIFSIRKTPWNQAKQTKFECLVIENKHDIDTTDALIPHQNVPLLVLSREALSITEFLNNII